MLLEWEILMLTNEAFCTFTSHAEVASEIVIYVLDDSFFGVLLYFPFLDRIIPVGKQW